MRVLLPIIAIVGAVALFFGPTKSALDASKPLVARRASLDAALASARKIQTVRDSLQEEYNSFSVNELSRLQKMLPSHVDNVRLVIDINAMASKYGMTLKDIQIGQSVVAPNQVNPSIASDSPEHLDIHFAVSGSYESLKLFLTDLGKSLRIVEITDLDFIARDTDIYDYSIGLRTYWLQDK